MPREQIGVVYLDDEHVDAAVEELKRFEAAAKAGTLGEYSHKGALIEILRALDLDTSRRIGNAGPVMRGTDTSNILGGLSGGSCRG